MWATGASQVVQDSSILKTGNPWTVCNSWPARPKRTVGGKTGYTTREVQHVEGEFVNCLKKKSSKIMPFDVRTTQELGEWYESSHLPRGSGEIGLLQDVVPELEWLDHETNCFRWRWASAGIFPGDQSLNCGTTENG